MQDDSEIINGPEFKVCRAREEMAEIQNTDPVDRNGRFLLATCLHSMDDRLVELVDYKAVINCCKSSSVV